MKEIILSRLQEIEQTEQVKILYAAESGNRAWGFASPDSAYDVRFLYLRRAEEYLRIDPPRDVIEWQLDEVLDINGWDVQKAFRLLRKSNPSLFEWANSPLVYQTSKSWDQILPMINSAFSSKRGVHHYLSMAGGNYREYLKGEQVRRKKYLYVLRPILACKWILANGTPPPILFDALVAAHLDASLKPVVTQLLEQKGNESEYVLTPRIHALNDYIEKNLTEITAQVKELEEPRSDQTEKLNQLFFGLLFDTGNLAGLR